MTAVRMTVHGLNSTLEWTHAPRLVALALVGFVLGVAFGIAGF